MKYVMYEIELGDGVKQLVPVIFPQTLVHKIVDQHFSKALVDHELKGVAVRAGDVNFAMGTPLVSGGSSTMGLDSDKEDANVIRMYSYTCGLVQ